MRSTALVLALATLPLAACGNYEDASAEAQADTVEIPANEPLENVTAVPVADPQANTDIIDAEVVEPAEEPKGTEPVVDRPAAAAPAATPAPAPAATDE